MGSKQDSKGRYYVDTVLRDVWEGVRDIVEDESVEKIVQYNTRAFAQTRAT